MIVEQHDLFRIDRLRGCESRAAQEPSEVALLCQEKDADQNQRDHDGAAMECREADRRGNAGRTRRERFVDAQHVLSNAFRVLEARKRCSHPIGNRLSNRLGNRVIIR